MITHLRQTLVLVGHGMFGHRCVQSAIERGQTRTAILGDGPGNVSGSGPGNGPEPVLVASTSIPVGAPR